MFPNAVGVTTCDDRHVFGSFMSREAAYRLMCSVWRPVAPAEILEPTAQKVPDVEVSECSVEDDSSCSISGNESSSHVKDKKSDLVDSGDSTNDKLTVTDGTKRSHDGELRTLRACGRGDSSRGIFFSVSFQSPKVLNRCRRKLSSSLRWHCSHPE
uniref:Uncharacterized membrane protein C20F10.07 n=2 Tax=Culex pipiens TaxID=7175 RepID=A0A8D8C7F8_CULPI